MKRKILEAMKFIKLISDNKNRVIINLTLLIFILVIFGCGKQFKCAGFDSKHPFLRIGISPELKDSLVYKSNTGEMIVMYKTVYELSKPHTESCGGIDQQQSCNCDNRIEIRYSDKFSKSYYCGFIIDDLKGNDDSSHYSNYSFFSVKVSRFFPRQDFNNISKFIDTLANHQIEFEGQTYSNIIELKDSINDINNIYKFWIRPDIGLYRFWIKDKYWTIN